MTILLFIAFLIRACLALALVGLMAIPGYFVGYAYGYPITGAAISFAVVFILTCYLATGWLKPS
jgi:hydrogenase/urease accessory protein HupE